MFSAPFPQLSIILPLFTTLWSNIKGAYDSKLVWITSEMRLILKKITQYLTNRDWFAPVFVLSMHP